MRRGFTILEILIVVAIMGIFGFVAVPSYQNFKQSNDLQVAFNMFINQIMRAQTKSQLSEGDSSWGVMASGTQIIVFKGASYASRDAFFDEKGSFSSLITVSSTNPEIVFSKLTGYPNSAIDLTLSNGLGEQKTLSINEKGAVIY